MGRRKVITVIGLNFSFPCTPADGDQRYQILRALEIRGEPYSPQLVQIGNLEQKCKRSPRKAELEPN